LLQFMDPLPQAGRFLRPRCTLERRWKRWSARETTLVTLDVMISAVQRSIIVPRTGKDGATHCYLARDAVTTASAS
jgi:hypothetical protein